MKIDLFGDGYNEKNFYEIERITHAERIKKKDKLGFVLRLQYYTSFLDLNSKKHIKTRDLRLIMPKETAIDVLKRNIYYLSSIKEGHSLYEYAKGQLSIIREYCVHHKYRIAEIYGTEDSSITINS